MQKSQPHKPVANKEIERTFLVKRAPKNLNQYPKQEILQGYLFVRGDTFLRIRQKDDKYSMAYKRGTGLVRDEIEIEITKDMFGALWHERDPKAGLGHKTRYLIPYRGKTVELNVYHGDIEGFMLAEIELKTESEKVELPDWLGLEVTDNKALKNPLTARKETERLIKLQIRK